MGRIIEGIKAFARFFIMAWPFGVLCKIDNGHGETYTVTKSLWVIVSDGSSSDALPLNFCSQELVDRVVAELSSRWWAAKPTSTEESK